MSVYPIEYVLVEMEFIRRQADALQAENSKLRELIHDMLPFAEAGMDNTCVTRSCCMFDKCTSEAGNKCLIEEHIAARMRELGVGE